VSAVPLITHFGAAADAADAATAPTANTAKALKNSNFIRDIKLKPPNAPI
jgi:hypothetical protein